MEWRLVLEFSTPYRVSEKGTIEVFTTSGWVPRKTAMTVCDTQYNTGYHKIKIRGVKTPQYLHRIVAKAFLPNPQGHKYVNHIDGDTNNNAVSNLEWCTQKHNMQNAVERGSFKCVSKNRERALDDVQVLTIHTLSHGKWSNRDIANFFPVGETNISRIKNGKNYTWLKEVCTYEKL